MPAQGIDILGLLSGGRAQIDAAALTARGAQVSKDLQTSLLKKMTRMGEIVGGRMGPDFTDALAQGARRGNAASQDTAIRDYGLDKARTQLYYLLGLAGLAILILTWKR